MSPEYTHYPIPNRRYKHYKGGIYKVHFLSKHTETGEILVNYQSILFGSYHSRPLNEWFQIVESLEDPGKNTLRFMED